MFNKLFGKAKNAVSSKLKSSSSFETTDKEVSSILGGMLKTVVTTVSLPFLPIIIIGFIVIFVVVVFLQVTGVPMVVFGVGTDSTNYCKEDPSQVEYAYEPLEGGLAIPHYRQQDERWGKIKMWDVDHWRWTTINAYGCSTTCMAMLASYYNDRSIYPDEVSVAIGVDKEGGMNAWQNGFKFVSEYYDITPPVAAESFDDVKEAVKNHQPVIVHYVGGSLFTTAGHFIVIRGMTADGKYLVNDPSDNPPESDWKGGYINRKFTEEEMKQGYDWAYIFEAKDCEFDEGTTDYIKWAIDIANDNSHGYSQCNGRSGPDYDCSSLVWHSLVYGGGFSKDVLGSTPFSTRNMAEKLKAAGFEEYTYTGHSDLQPGDILWKYGHTGMYVGDDQVVQALPRNGVICYDETGDQNGNEISVKVDNRSWTKYYRFMG